MKKLLFFIVIFIFALGLRTYKLADNPPGLTWDEAALGYNAYSILKTGRDEFGDFMPIIFKSFGDYKPGAYVYLTVPSIAVFGLTEFAIRLPSALFGSLAVVGVGLLVSLVFENFLFGVFSSVFLALMPWHIHFSRGAWEVNIFVTFLVYAIYFFFQSLKNNKISPIISALLFSATIFTYQAGKLISPLVFILLVATNLKQSKETLSRVFTRERRLLPLYLLIISLVGIYFYQTVTGPAGNRVSRLSIFQYKPKPSADLIKTDNGNLTSVVLFHSQIDLTARAIASRYLYHFSPEILFKENNTPRESLPKMGLLYLLDAIWLFAGLIFLSRHTENKKQFLIFGLLFIAPLGASLTLAEYSAVRALFMTVPLAIIGGAGVYYLYSKHRLIFVLVVLVYFHNVLYGLDILLNHSKAFFAPGFNYGYKEAIQAIKDHPSKKVYMTDVYGQPYIYYLFYTAYDPAKYQKINNFVSGGVDVGSVGRVDNVEFHQFSVDDIKTQKDTLFIGTNGNIPDSFDYNLPQVELYDQISYPNGSPVFRYIKSKP